jgi:superfamily II DNA/RNA helicase
MGIRAESIHGDKTQYERMDVIQAFKRGDFPVLVATDVAARGLDIKGLATGQASRAPNVLDTV